MRQEKLAPKLIAPFVWLPDKHPLQRLTAVCCIFILLIGLLGGCTAKTPGTTASSVAETSSGTSTTTAAEINPTIAAETAGGLYPAYVRANGAKLWGYIDAAGEFALAPAFGMADDFQTNGLAKVQLDGHMGLIDRQGQWVVEPTFDNITDFSEGIATAYVWDNATDSSLLDDTGKVIAQVKGSVSAFKNGQALVYAADGSQYYINTKGEKVADYQSPATEPGNTLLYDQEFADGLAIVGKSVDYKDVYGLFAADGQAILPQEYAGIERLGDKLFAAAKETADIFWYRDLPKALFDQNGKRLSDFVYYDLTAIGDGLISVSDLHDTYLLDEAGKSVASLGKLPGNGMIELDQGLFKATIDQQLSYYTLAGQLVWQEDPVDQLANGWQVTRQKLSPDRFTVIYYPEIAGLSDPAVQTTINAGLKAAFDSDAASVNFDGSQAAPGTVYYSAEFSAEAAGALLVVQQTGYLYPIGAAHGMPTQTYIHSDSRTGQVYALKDLFRAGEDYKTQLKRKISQQIQTQEAAGSMMFDTKNPPLNEKDFRFTADHLELYFDPYEIAAYAAGFPTFSIPYTEIQDLIDPESLLWQAIQGS